MRKGQLEIGVTVMVLFVFFILLVISLIFFFQFSGEDIRGEREVLLEDRFSGLLNVVVNMPELRCSRDAISRECLDAVNLLAFDGNNNYYSDIFAGINQITVEIVYPTEIDGVIYKDVEKTCDKDNYDPLCGKFILLNKDQEGRIYSSPILVYDPLTDRNLIGRLSLRANI